MLQTLFACTHVSHLDLSVDLRDAVGDRLYLTDGFRRDGVRNAFISYFRMLTSIFYRLCLTLARRTR
jgi:hypothetical protein